MKSDQLLNLSIKLIRFFRLVWAGMFVLLTIGLVAVMCRYASLQSDSLLLWRIWITSTSSIALIASVTLFTVPTYKVYLALERLISKIHINPKAVLSQTREYRQLKKYLIIQFFINAFFEMPLENVRSWMASHDPITSVSQSSTVQDAYYLQIQQISTALFGVFTKIKWLYPSLEHTMPLFFLAILILVARVQQENLMMKKELEEVI